MPISPNNLEPSEKTTTSTVKPFSKKRIIKNLVVVSLATLFVLGTDDIMILFQSSVNRANGMGVASVAAQYAFAFLSSFFLPKYLILKYGCKTIMILSILLFIPFFVANYYPIYYLMVLSSVLLGVGFSLFWGSIDPYINNLSCLYVDHQVVEMDQKIEIHFDQITKPIEKQKSLEQDQKVLSFSGSCYYIGSEVNKKTKPSIKYNLSSCNIIETKHENKKKFFNYCCVKKPKLMDKDIVLSDNDTKSKTVTLESTTVRMFGFHALIYQTSYVLSSVVAFFVLHSGYTQTYSSTYANETCLCGSSYCNVGNECSELNLHSPSTEGWNILTSVCVGVGFFAAILVALFIDGLQIKDKNVAFSLDILLATFRQIKKRNQLLLMPLTINSGMMKGFFVADFTKSYIGCAWGIQYVGLVTICAGMAMAFFSTVSGWFVKHLGRIPIFTTAAIVNIALNVILILWQPNPNYPAMFFITAGMWGGIFGTLQTQVRAFYGVLFRDEEEAAFGAYQLWYCVGACLCLSYSNLICNDIKIYVLIINFTLGITGYLIVERSHSLIHKSASSSTH